MRASVAQQVNRRDTVLAALAGSLSVVMSGTGACAQTGAVAFPAAGRKLLVTFPKFRAELDFHSHESLTWTLFNADGSRGRFETVAISVQPIAEAIFMVTWQEANKTTVVQVEDFAQKVIYTNITRPDGTFLQSRGTFVEAS